MRLARFRPLRILSHYFIGRYLGVFVMVLAVALLVLATVELVLNFDDVASFDSARQTEAGSINSPSAAATLSLTPEDSLSPLSLQRATNVLRYLGIRLASYYLADLLPIASFVSVFLVFALAGRSMERLATEAGGIPPVRIILPVLATALILSFAAAVLHETVGLRAEQLGSGERVGGAEGINFGREAFWLHKGPTITNVSHADADTRTLFGVEIFERGPEGTIVRVIRSDRVRIADDGRWHVDAARIWRFDPADPAIDPILEEVSSVVLDLDSLRGDRLLGADPGMLPLPDLARYLESAPSLTGSTLRRLENRYHQRLSRPWLVFVFAWLALPFALRVDARGRFAGPALAAVTVLGLYFLAESAGRTLAQQGLISIGVAPWLTMALFGLGAALALLLRRS